MPCVVFVMILFLVQIYDHFCSKFYSQPRPVTWNWRRKNGYLKTTIRGLLCTKIQYFMFS